MEAWWGAPPVREGLFRSLRSEDVSPEQFMPLPIRQPLHHPVHHRQATDPVDLCKFPYKDKDDPLKCGWIDHGGLVKDTS